LQAFRASCALHLTQMVNVGFPEKPGMVSKWWMRQTHAAFLAQAGHQSRLFDELNQSDFWRNFEELSPMQ
jgi:hypothetical protein